MSPRTIFLGRLIGLFCILFALSMFARKDESVEAVNALVHDAPLMLMTGLVTLAAGLAMVLSHNVWSGGALPITVTIIGWVTLIKSLLLLFLPQDAESGPLVQGIRFNQFFYFYAAFSFLLGAYLVYAASKSKAR